MQQEVKNSTKGNSDQDWKESRSQLHSNNWERGRMGNKENRNNRDDKMSNRGKMNTRDDVMGSNGDQMGGSNDRMGNKRDKMGGNSDRSSSRNDRMGSSSDRIGYSDRMGGRKDRYDYTDSSHDDRFEQNDYFKGREDFPQSGEYGTVSFFTIVLSIFNLIIIKHFPYDTSMGIFI